MEKMERKNTILLTIISVATLLVAAVGATFAYFTSTLTINSTNKSNTSAANAKTRTLVSATFDYGSAITASTTALPGHTDLKTMKVTGTAGDTSAKIRLTMTPNIATEFGSDIHYTLYSANTSDIATKNVTCTASKVVSSVQSDGSVRYYDSSTCTANGSITKVKEGSFTGTTAVTQDITVAANSNVTYYLVVQYVNNTEAAQSAQGKSYSVTLSVKSLSAL